MSEPSTSTVSTQTYPDQIFQLEGDASQAYLFLLQASSPTGEPLTLAQLDAARSAAASVLEIVGARVASVSAVTRFDTIPTNHDARLVVTPRVELNPTRLADLVQNESDASVAPW